MAFVANLMRVPGWLVDSGCTDHMTFSSADFVNLSMSQGGGDVLGAGGEGMEIKERGEVALELGGENRLILFCLSFSPSKRTCVMPFLWKR